MHRELVQAYTTAAIYNLLGAPEKPITESQFMPNLLLSKVKEEEPIMHVSTDEVETFNAKRAHIAALLQAYRNTGVADPQLVTLGLVSKAHE